VAEWNYRILYSVKGGEDLCRSGHSSKYTLVKIYHITNLSTITNLSKLETKLGLRLGLSPSPSLAGGGEKGLSPLPQLSSVRGEKPKLGEEKGLS